VTRNLDRLYEYVELGALYPEEFGRGTSEDPAVAAAEEAKEGRTALA
jgi:hypothetical protein